MATMAMVSIASADVIANFDFTGPPWTATKEDDFATFAVNAPSADTDLFSSTSILSSSGYGPGGYDSFYIRDADPGTTIFSTSATPGVGMNIAGADQTVPTNYLSFTVRPDPGYETTFESLSFYTDANFANEQYDIQLVVLDGSSETVLGTASHTTGGVVNEPVVFKSLDFADFTSSGLVEFRLYAYNMSASNGGIRIDDIVLNGVTTAPGTPATVPVDHLTLIDHTFDGVANDVGPAFQQVTNGLGTGGLSNLSTGAITTGSNGGGRNSTYGFNNAATIDVGLLDPSAIGFRATFEVGSVNADVSSLSYNGLFFGLVSGTGAIGTEGPGLWNQDPDAFGYVAGSDSYGNHVLRQDGDTNFPMSTVRPTAQSIQDGFTVSVSVFSDNSWRVTSTGLSTELDHMGFLKNSDFTYADIVNELGLSVSLQGEDGATIDIDRITLTTLSPASAVLAPEIISVTRSGDLVTVQFVGIDGATYALNKSTTLDFSTLNSQNSITLDGTDTGELQDTNATEDSAFYRIEQQ